MTATKSYIPLIGIISLLLFSSACSEVETLPESKAAARIVRGECHADILGFCEDSVGTIWMRTGYDGLYRAKGQILLHYSTNSEEGGNISSNIVNAMEASPDGTIWAGTRRGVDRFDEESDGFVHYNVDSYDSYIRGILFDAQGHVYARSWRSLFKFDEESLLFKPVLDFRAVTRDEIIPLFDNEGHLWVRYSSKLLRFTDIFERDLSLDTGFVPVAVVPLEGILIILDGNGSLHSINTASGENVPLPSSLSPLSEVAVRSIFLSPGGLMSFQTDKGRAVLDTENGDLYTAWGDLSPFDSFFTGAGRNCILKDRSSNLWFPGIGGGYRAEKIISEMELSHPKLLSCLRDDSWFSPAWSGKYFWVVLSGNRLLTYDMEEREVKDVSSLYGITGSTHAIRQIHPSKDGTLMASGYGRTDTSVFQIGFNEKGIPFLLHRFTAPEVITATMDNNGEVWAFAAGSRFYRSGPIPSAQLDVELFPVSGITPINEISYSPQNIPLEDGRIVFGASNNNPILLDPCGPSVSEIPIRDEKFQVFWNCFLQDSRGDLWIGSTSYGVYRYFLSEGRVEQLPGTDNVGASLIYEDQGGDIFLQCTDRRMLRWDHDSGEITLLWSDEEHLSPERWLLVLPDGGSYIYDGRRVLAFSKKGVEQDISGLPIVLVLSYNDRELKSFSTADADSDNRIRLRLRSLRDIPYLSLSVDLPGLGNSYEYRLAINRSGEMTRVASQAFENSLHSLHYGRNHIRFQVKPSSGTEYGPMYTLILSVPRPMWFWIIFLAATLMVTALAFMGRSLILKKREAAREREEREMQERLNEFNINSFANISHEFRSPLTLINAALSSIEGSSSQDETEKAIMLAKRNVSRMMNLTTQLMDFNKLDHGKLTLSLSYCDISAQIRKIWEAFEVGADQKNVDWHLNGCEESHEGWADTDKLEKILWNLCSNALKFTPPGGVVDVDCSFMDRTLTVRVLDTGIGLEEDKMSHLFERFNQSEAARQIGGTGIGLFYTKSLVELHHGSISAGNRTDGPGAVFTFSIPTGEEAYTPEERSSLSDSRSTAVRPSPGPLDMDEVEPSHKDESLPSVLLIDDDYDLIYYLRSLFFQGLQCLLPF